MCSANELLRMERLILEKFEWFVDFVTANDFLQIVKEKSLSIFFSLIISCVFLVLCTFTV